MLPIIKPPEIPYSKHFKGLLLKVCLVEKPLVADLVYRCKTKMLADETWWIDYQSPNLQNFLLPNFLLLKFF